MSFTPVKDPAGADRHVDVDVLVVGAGPTGLTAACEAVRHGLSVRIVDRKPHRSTYSKALVVHARTLEVFETMGVVDAVLAEGTRFAALNTHTGRRRPVRVDLLDQPWGDTAYPFWLSIPQYATERILHEHLRRLGVEVEWGVALDGLHDHGDHVEGTLGHEDGDVEVVRAHRLIGCDGGRSRVRDQAGLRLDRSPTGATFVLADVRTTASLTEDEGHVFLGPSGLLLIVPMPEPGRWRVIAHVPRPAPESPITVDADLVDELVRQRAGLEFGAHDLTWESHFDLSDGLADHYRRGRVFLAGDAAHVHSPVGGQGLNTGVQDAHNLVWKLAAARRMDTASADALLDSYEQERRPVAHAMVRGTARATGLLTRPSGVIRALFGAAAPRILARPAVQARLGRRVGMLDVAYRDGSSAVALGTSTLAGRRMPNPELRSGGRLHDRLDATGHTWVVWGRPGETLLERGDRWEGIPVVLIPEDAPAEGERPRFGDEERVMLVRPDRHVAAAGPSRKAVWSELQGRTSLTGGGRSARSVPSS